MPVIIFCTAYDEFAIKAFELNAADYLLKPFNKERFNQAVEKALNTINKQNGGNNENQVLHHVKEQEEHLDRVVIKKNDEILIIPAEDIDYITSEDDYIMIHTHKGKYLKNSTMNYMEKHLPISRFLRIHRTSIINLDRISKMEKYDKETYLIHLSMGQKFKCSKQGTKKLRARFNI
jgi:two-component system LytT family response regulator